MNRTACLLLAATLVAPLTGCVVRAEVEPLVRYDGTQVSESVAYNSGLPIHIISANGQVEVVPGGSTDVEVTFSPFTMGEEGADEAAKREMEEILGLSVAGSGVIEIEVTRGEGASSGLGADILVRLPSTFDSGFEVTQNNGSVDVDLSGTNPTSTVVASGNGSVTVNGARGRLAIATDNGSVDVDVDAWSAENGSVASGNGDVNFTLPSDTNGRMTADTANGEIIESGFPSNWVSDGASPAKSYTMGDGMGGQVDLSTDLGDITITAR